MAEPIVEPRALSPESGESLPLADLVQDIVGAAGSGVVAVIAGPRRGKTTALDYLAARLEGVTLLDEPDDLGARDGVIVYGGCAPLEAEHMAVLPLAPWGRDECIEYLLARHREQCNAVMARIDDIDDMAFLEGIPELWATVLDVLAADERIPDVRAAIWSRAPSIVRHAPVRRLLAAEKIMSSISGDPALLALVDRLPHAIVREAARRLTAETAALLARSPKAAQPMATSILHAAGQLPDPSRLRRLKGAYLEGVAWPGADLRNAGLELTDFTGANLRGARLDGTMADLALFDGACLRGAFLTGFHARGASFKRADLREALGMRACLELADLTGALLGGAVLIGAALRHADLREALLANADLAGVQLRGARIEGAAFTEANLTAAQLQNLPLRKAAFGGAVFHHANLKGCDLDGMELDEADFRGACLDGASFTGARMPGARLADASLVGARAGDVDWEGADLRRADMSGVTFHMGSSRGGLLDSPIASEGTRTGFYTDEYDERHFKAPEEVRKANLRGADLRETRIDDTDFYLVDLRGARYDRKQAAWFGRCGAILETPGEG